MLYVLFCSIYYFRFSGSSQAAIKSNSSADNSNHKVCFAFQSNIFNCFKVKWIYCKLILHSSILYLSIKGEYWCNTCKIKTIFVSFYFKKITLYTCISVKKFRKKKLYKVTWLVLNQNQKNSKLKCFCSSTQPIKI